MASYDVSKNSLVGQPWPHIIGKHLTWSWYSDEKYCNRWGLVLTLPFESDEKMINSLTLLKLLPILVSSCILILKELNIFLASQWFCWQERHLNSINNYLENILMAARSLFTLPCWWSALCSQFVSPFKYLKSVFILYSMHTHTHDNNADILTFKQIFPTLYIDFFFVSMLFVT